jgi:hypothetical protein
MAFSRKVSHAGQHGKSLLQMSVEPSPTLCCIGEASGLDQPQGEMMRPQIDAMYRDGNMPAGLLMLEAPNG